MKNENIGTTKRRKQMLLNNKNKDKSIYYYGPESKYISNHCDSKFPALQPSYLRYIVNAEEDEDESNASAIKNKAKSANKSRGRPPRALGISRALFKEDRGSAQKSKFRVFSAWVSVTYWLEFAQFSPYWNPSSKLYVLGSKGRKIKEKNVKQEEQKYSSSAHKIKGNSQNSSN